MHLMRGGGGTYPHLPCIEAAIKQTKSTKAKQKQSARCIQDVVKHLMWSGGGTNPHVPYIATPIQPFVTGAFRV